MKKDRALSFVSKGIAAVILLAPTPLIAGGYGSSAVADSNVSNQQTAQGMVWCERLDANITESLSRQMDCGSGEVGVARPAVAGERITNRRKTFFERFPHNRKGPAASNGSDDDSVTTVSTTPTGGPSTGGPTTGEPESDGPTSGEPSTPTNNTPTTRVNKWERMNELGITRDNFHAQGQDFVDQAFDYGTNRAPDEGWSNFTPDE